MINISKQSGKDSTYLTEFIADSASDIVNLPKSDKCAVGSVCFVIESSSVYMLGSDDIWHEI